MSTALKQTALTTVKFIADVPDDWTAKQYQMAIWKCQQWDVPFDPTEWTNYGEYIGREFKGHSFNMFIGIEKDGYAHT